ncbi:esterase-like activity of phytase family protein [Acinetobacter pseudolwoffii]|uniref:Phytase esterase n=1 Tax=Acinetobacter pseudolwoffii TaxID=2053287 RepID=A0A2H9YPG6_9GAMM|nr:esterase-like activity of phytase family protein [Acinetobacter pseudolwoffii]PJO74543.1 phytase esterase [Acinetobacter pseudolwoffii]
MRKISLSLLAVSVFALTACNESDDKTLQPIESVTEPTLVSFAKLDVETYAEGSDSGRDVRGANGIFPPFSGQPVQGFSAALKQPDGTYLVMSDNGFGSQDNSSDYLLRLHHLSSDFRTKAGGTATVKHLSYIQLRDPNKLIPFEIVHQNTQERLLTGADFDPESMQRAPNGDIWIGDEFGPYLLHFSADGILKSPPIALAHPLEAGTELRSPQNQLNKGTIGYINGYIEPLVQQSGGFEGMAISPNGRYLYPLLEKPLLNATTPQLIISEFDLEKKVYTGNFYYFELASKASAIGDFQLFSAKEGVIIERDDSENNLGGYKKLIKVRLNQSGESVAREELVNLMDLANPDLLYGPVRPGDLATGQRFGFPFQTIEDIIIEGPDLITVLNDNNFPGSSGRNRNLADDNEIIQIRLAQALY